MKRLLKTLLPPYWILCFILTHAPLPPGALSQPGIDKVYHFLGYWILAFLLQAFLEGKRKTASERFRLGFTILFIYGFLDELTQPYFSRVFDLLDLGADTMGIILGSLLFLKIFPEKSADQFQSPP